MVFYIDPGTGSMLFTILIGLAGAAIYAARGLFLKGKVALGGGRKAHKNDGKEEIVFFTDSKRYENIFRPLCDEMEKRGQSVLYLTASPDDPMLERKYEHIRSEFIGEGNKAFVRMNFIRSSIVLSSTPGLDVYQWKRSRDADWYVHVLHAPNDVTMYRMFGLDYYDAVLVSGEYQIRQLREMERLRGLPEKEAVMAGLPGMDDQYRRLQEAGTPAKGTETTVLLAPSWGPRGLLTVYGKRILEKLLETSYHIVVRPHPQSMVSEKEMIDALRKEFPDSDRLELNFDNDNFDVLNRSDILISDFSGVMFEFTLVFGKPLIYADVSFDREPYDSGWLEEEPWTFTSLPRLGMQLTEENFGRIGEMIETCLHSSELKEGREQARQETWANIGHSAEVIADYLIRKKEELVQGTEAPATESKEN